MLAEAHVHIVHSVGVNKRTQFEHDIVESESTVAIALKLDLMNLVQCVKIFGRKAVQTKTGRLRWNHGDLAEKTLFVLAAGPALQIGGLVSSQLLVIVHLMGDLSLDEKCLGAASPVV